MKYPRIHRCEVEDRYLSDAQVWRCSVGVLSEEYRHGECRIVGQVVPLDALVIERRDEASVEKAAKAMWLSDLGGHGLAADVSWESADEGERQWYRNILTVGLDALAAAEEQG